MSITIIKAGLQDTIQDNGRYGYQQLGINPSGAMDRYAMQVTNMLVGNDPSEAVIEMHFPASVFLFTEPAMIAIGGADFSASINGEVVPLLHGIRVEKNDVLQFQKWVKGARAYLAVRGGIAVPPWLNSLSTNIKAAAGGYSGRGLQKNDEIPLRHHLSILNDPKNLFRVLPWSADIEFDHSEKIFVLPGNEWDRLIPDAKENFKKTSFLITQQSDRMGYRLDNIPLTVSLGEELVSAAVNFGTIQLLPDGKLIVLMADHQTTGGYPRIAHVISAHHSKLAQLKAGDKMNFELTDQQKAEELLIKQHKHLHQLQVACAFRLEEYFKTNG